MLIRFKRISIGLVILNYKNIEDLRVLRYVIHKIFCVTILFGGLET